VTSCEGHAALPAEFRALLNKALDRIEPVVERVRNQQRPGPGERDGGAGSSADSGIDSNADGGVPMGSAAACGVCPVCAVVAVLRGERSELAAQAVDHVSGLMAVLRAALDEGAGDPAAPPERAARAACGGRPVQRIRVRRAPGSPPGQRPANDRP
jgi:hypothetical protein